MPGARPHVVAVLPGFSASTIMDVILPLVRLDRSGAVRFSAWLDFYPFAKHLQSADLFIFCRNVEPNNRRYLDFAISRNIPYVYDIDDNLFEISTGTELSEYYRAPERVDLLNTYLHSASLVRVYSSLLKQCIQPLNTKVEQVLPPLHWSLIRPRPLETKNKPIKIIYATSRNNDMLADIFLPALDFIQTTYQDQVEIYFWGYIPKDMVGRKGVRFIKPEPNYRVFMKKFSEMHFDIGLAPLKDDLFHRSKTNNKFREYAACGIAGIYSNVDVYASCVENGRSGLLVENTRADWQAALVRLVEDAHLREEISTAAYAVVREKYPVEEFSDTWKRQIDQLLSQENSKKAAFQAEPRGAPALPTIQPIQNRSILRRLLSRWNHLSQILKAELYNVWVLVKINWLKRI